MRATKISRTSRYALWLDSQISTQTGVIWLYKKPTNQQTQLHVKTQSKNRKEVRAEVSAWGPAVPRSSNAAHTSDSVGQGKCPEKSQTWQKVCVGLRSSLVKYEPEQTRNQITDRNPVLVGVLMRFYISSSNWVLLKTWSQTATTRCMQWSKETN
jgi:hypothetical protein